jgi:NAD dependent epimerase/dehydratase family enzyme
VNLAGRSVNCIKTPDHCDEILRSRVESTEVIGRALQRLKALPRVWVQMATAHRYGDPPEGIVIDEDSAFGYGLAPTVGAAWEDAFARSAPAGNATSRTSHELRARPQRRRTRDARATGPARPGRDDSQRPAGDELASRPRHESVVHPRNRRRLDDRRLHRDCTEPEGFEFSFPDLATALRDLHK